MKKLLFFIVSVAFEYMFLSGIVKHNIPKIPEVSTKVVVIMGLSFLQLYYILTLVIMYGTLFENNKKKEIKPKPRPHEHCFCITIGKYYKLYRTEYRNCFDYVYIYERKSCSCGKMKDIKISENSFLPSMHSSDSEERNFINKIKKDGIEEEYELNIRTKTYSERYNQED